MVRIVARKEGLVHADVLQRRDPLAGNHLQHAVDQQDRIAVRQVFENLVDVHAGIDGSACPCFAHDFFSNAASRCSRARILSAIASR
jgi:hypothetical protein